MRPKGKSPPETRRALGPCSAPRVSRHFFLQFSSPANFHPDLCPSSNCRVQIISLRYGAHKLRRGRGQAASPFCRRQRAHTAAGRAPHTRHVRRPKPTIVCLHHPHNHHCFACELPAAPLTYMSRRHAATGSSSTCGAATCRLSCAWLPVSPSSPPRSYPDPKTCPTCS